MKQYIEANKQLKNILNNQNDNLEYSSLYKDYSSSIDKLIAMVGEYDVTLSDEEIKLLNDLKKLYSNINWVYPE